MLYIVIGLLVINTGRAEDAAGVMQYLSGGFGKWLLFAMAAGFAGYGVWRLADAAFAIECHDDDNEVWKRLAAAVSGVVHLYLANQSLDAMEGAAKLAGGGGQDQAATVLQLPGGQILLGAVALVLAAAGIAQLVTAAKCGFMKHLSHEARQGWIKWLGRAGYAARGMVFLIAAYFAARAAYEDRSSLVGGIEQALEWLSSPTRTVVAAGLLLFGIYGLIEAWYRRIHTIDAAEAGRRVADQVTG